MLSLKTNEQENFISLIPSNSIPKKWSRYVYCLYFKNALTNPLYMKSARIFIFFDRPSKYLLLLR